MKKIIMIKKNHEFKYLYHRGATFVFYNLVVYYLKNNYKYSRYGITISSKVGNAVVRNKIKRRLREILKKYYNNIKLNFDIVLIVRHKASLSSSSDLEKTYKHFIYKLSKTY